jgi:hypothetical protein
MCKDLSSNPNITKKEERNSVFQLFVVAHVYKPSTQEAEAGVSQVGA